VLNSAGYGPVTITQSVTITNPGGVEAGVTATSGENAITITTGAASNVTLRGLTLEGNGVGLNGIVMTSALSDSGTTNLNIVDCVVKDFTADGIDLVPTSGSSPTLNVVIQNTDVLNNGQVGIAVNPDLAAAIVTMY
jgi:hypothetical protein